MTIQEAKQQIQYAVSAYLTKDDQGNYVIPVTAQRPVFVMGPPGIGKTEIMKQVAQELGIGLVSYSMTHHTRQSALGLPTIVQKQYGGETYDVSEYTMSEILSTVYDVVEEDGMAQGILFLDEINCVSETLAPSMLQFLQFKTFGRHRVPDGWVVVTAGNPPEYNNSVREFDIVTWDRLKRVDVEPDFQTWKEYAISADVHPAILTYLELHNDEFYKIETTVDGKQFVTARGWVDLSQMLRLFEEKNFPVDKILIAQYLQNEDTAKGFSAYHSLFQKYQTIFNITEILDGSYQNDLVEKAKNGGLEEQMALVSLLQEYLVSGIKTHDAKETTLLSFAKDAISHSGMTSLEQLQTILADKTTKLDKMHHAGALSTVELRLQKDVIRLYGDMIHHFETKGDAINVQAYVKDLVIAQNQVSGMEAELLTSQLSNGLAFAKAAFDKSQVFFMLMSRLTANPLCVKFLSLHAVEVFQQESGDLLIHDQRQQILLELDRQASLAPSQNP